jgi:hypothetical protein
VVEVRPFVAQQLQVGAIRRREHTPVRTRHMPLTPSLLRQMAELCAELGPEDGEPTRKTHHPKENLNHQRRLCGQVFRLLSVTFPAADDPVLRSVNVESVTLDPGGALRVRVTHAESDPGVLLAHLGRARPWLRSEIATYVGGKRTPEIILEVTP